MIFYGIFGAIFALMGKYKNFRNEGTVLKKYKWGYVCVTPSKNYPKTYKNLTNCSVTVLQLVLKKNPLKTGDAVN